MELLLNSINLKKAEIRLINGLTITGTVEYRKIILDKIDYKRINNKRLKMLLVTSFVITGETKLKAAKEDMKLLFLPIRSISSLTCPEIENPWKHIKMYIKNSTLS
ncbi:hypothetical protein HWI79_2971 [Cryptosporidium felis]|nr:hypothetical protein HWI79_2971 [Cryptosporidium felis]